MLPEFKEIHIENTNACGYHCMMCPRESHSRQKGFMAFEDFQLVLKRIQTFEGIVHLHGFGESLLDRKLPEKILFLKQTFPKAYALIFSTLGVKFKNDYLVKLLEAGLNGLVISLYGFTQKDYQMVHGFDGFELVKKNLLELSQIKKTFNCDVTIKVPDGNISTTLPIAEPIEKSEFCRWASNLGFNLGKWTYVHNYSNGKHYNLPNHEKMCPVVNGYRKQLLNITWDLNVIPCCYDYNSTICFGNLRSQSLEEIFSGEKYLNFIVAHQMGQLQGFPICQNCEKSDYI